MIGTTPFEIPGTQDENTHRHDIVETHGLSLSPEERKYLINYGRGRKQSLSDISTLITLKSQFANEFISECILKKHYLETTEREPYHVTCENSFFYNAQHKLLYGAFVYILLPNDQLYCVELDKNINHSYLSAGLGVKGAGIVYFEAGRLMTLSNESGHYTPTFAEMSTAIDWFYQQVKGHRFLFEDHSAQDKTVEFNGIRYFLVSPSEDKNICKKELLKNDDLSQTLQEIRNNELSYYYDHLTVREQSESHSAEEKEIASESEEGSDGVYISTVNLDIKEFPPKSPIFDHPELLSLTVLSKYQDSLDGKPLSRYGCTLKHSGGK